MIYMKDLMKATDSQEKTHNSDQVLLQYGRNFFTRYDYEGCASAPCEQMMTNLEALVIIISNS